MIANIRHLVGFGVSVRQRHPVDRLVHKSTVISQLLSQQHLAAFTHYCSQYHLDFNLIAQVL